MSSYSKVDQSMIGRACAGIADTVFSNSNEQLSQRYHLYDLEMPQSYIMCGFRKFRQGRSGRKFSCFLLLVILLPSTYLTQRAIISPPAKSHLNSDFPDATYQYHIILTFFLRKPTPL